MAYGATKGAEAKGTRADNTFLLTFKDIDALEHISEEYTRPLI